MEEKQTKYKKLSENKELKSFTDFTFLRDEINEEINETLFGRGSRLTIIRDKEVKKFGRACHVILPKKFEDKRCTIIIEGGYSYLLR